MVLFLLFFFFLIWNKERILVRLHGGFTEPRLVGCPGFLELRNFSGQGVCSAETRTVFVQIKKIGHPNKTKMCIVPKIRNALPSQIELILKSQNLQNQNTHFLVNLEIHWTIS